MVSTVFCASLGDDAISSSFDHRIVEQGDAQGIFFVFDRGKSPDIGAIRSFVEATSDTFVSVEQLRNAVTKPVLAPDDNAQDMSSLQTLSVQLLHGGLTFDLVFSPDGQSDGFRSDLANFDCDWPLEAGLGSTLQLRPGHHIGSGANSLPIMRRFMELARDFVLHFDQIAAVIWPPAKSVIGRRYFDSSISAWLERGVFPPQGLVAFREAANGEFHSQGLDYFIGQELRIAADLMDDAGFPAGLSARLVNQLILSGTTTERQDLIAPNGRRISLNPIADGKIILVR